MRTRLGAQRGADRHLALPAHAARQQHHGHIHAGNQQHKDHARRHHPQRLPLIFAGNVPAQRHHPRGAAFVGVRMRLPDIGQHMIHVGLRLRHAQPGLEPSNDLQPVIAARGAQLFRYAQRRVDQVGQAEREAKSRRHHAHDGVGKSVDVHRLSNHAGIAAEVLLPDLIAEHGHVVAPVLLLTGNERATQ